MYIAMLFQTKMLKYLSIITDHEARIRQDTIL